MKFWPIFLLCLAVMFFFANYTPKEKDSYKMLDNGCMIYAIHYKNALEAKAMLGEDIWSRVLAIHFYGTLGHAVTVFVYKNITYVYDYNLGTYPIANYPLYDPMTIAEICFPRLPIRKAYYIEPTFLLYYKSDNTFKID